MTGMIEERDELCAEIDRLSEALREANLTIDAEQERVERMLGVGVRLARLGAERVISDTMSPDTVTGAVVLLKIALNIEQAARDIPLDPEPSEYI